MIAALLVSCVTVGAFAVALWASAVVGVARTAVSTALNGLNAITDARLDDDAKERAVRAAAFSLFGSAFSLALRFVGVLAAAAIPVLAADLIGLVSADVVLALMLRLDFILVVSIAAFAVAVVLKRRLAHRRARDTASINSYSELEQFLHNLAFSSSRLQRGVAALEDRILGAPQAAQVDPPIFVTSLARGGTTALLNALSVVPGIATHTYRDMPFVTAPKLWDQLAGGTRRTVATRERAHGDGLSIDLDAPEAFEEVVWKLAWPRKYAETGIQLWGPEDQSEQVNAFLARHMAKIIRARFGQSPDTPVRYCSKNNANLARLEYLCEAFPGCSIIVPLRDPARHAASLHRQHMNFLHLQSEDDFVAKYMGDIGHFEFGQVLKPLMFPGMEAKVDGTKKPDYWLHYWLRAFRYVEAQIMGGRELILVTQDRLRAHPDKTMARLSTRLSLTSAEIDFAPFFRSSPDTGDDSIFDQDLLEEARALYSSLAKVSL